MEVTTREDAAQFPMRPKFSAKLTFRPRFHRRILRRRRSRGSATVRSGKLKLDVANETGKIIGMSAVPLVRANGSVSNRHERISLPGKKFTPSSLQGNFTIRVSRAAEIVYPTLFFPTLPSPPLSLSLSPSFLSFFRPVPFLLSKSAPSLRLFYGAASS